MELDKDLASIQEVRNLMAAAKAAQKQLAGYDQLQIDTLVRAMAEACLPQVQKLAEMAVEETGFGNVPDKVQKNLLGCKTVYEYIKDMKTVGVVEEDKERKIIDIAVPVGVVAAVIPSTNPTSTVMYKALISIKAGNSVVFSPHPGAKNCILETCGILRRALRDAGGPEDAVQCITTPTLDATKALMQHKSTGLILATGGPGMVKAAYSSGNPALGVGAGNGPAFIERSADIPAAIRHIIASKTFDNGTICASEQSIVAEEAIEDAVLAEAKKQGMYCMSAGESQKVGAILMRANGSMSPAIVGRTAVQIAEMAGITVPAGTKVLLSARQDEVSEKNPYAREKLCPVLGFYVARDWEAACERCIELLENEGIGHTMVVHSEDFSVIREFALRKPVMRLLVNTPGALGGTGVTTNLAPALTLGCGAMGKTATSDNVTPLNLVNIRRLAFGVRETPGEVATQQNAPAPAPCEASARGAPVATSVVAPSVELGAAEIEGIVSEVIARLSQKT